MKAPSIRSGNSVRTFLSLLQFAFKFWGVISITFIIVLLTNINGIKESREQGSLLPFIEEVGLKLFNYDSNLYDAAVQIEENNGLKVDTEEKGETFFSKFARFWDTVKSYGKVFINLWYLWAFGVIYYGLAVLLTNNESARTSNIVLAIIFIATMQIFANLVFVENNDQNNVDKFIPYKGVIKLVSVLPQSLQPVYEYFVDNETINKTENTQQENYTDVLYITNINITGA